jgi:hypothetical protein
MFIGGHQIVFEGYFENTNEDQIVFVSLIKSVSIFGFKAH